MSSYTTGVNGCISALVIFTDSRLELYFYALEAIIRNNATIFHLRIRSPVLGFIVVPEVQDGLILETLLICDVEPRTWQVKDPEFRNEDNGTLQETPRN